MLLLFIYLFLFLVGWREQNLTLKWHSCWESERYYSGRLVFRTVLFHLSDTLWSWLRSTVSASINHSSPLLQRSAKASLLETF